MPGNSELEYFSVLQLAREGSLHACSQPARLLPQLLGSRYHPAVQDTLHPSSDSQSYLLPPSWVAVASHMMQFAHVPVVGGNYDSDGVVCEISDRVVGIYNMHVNASHA